MKYFDLDFYKGKHVFITGFKGSYLSPTEPNLFSMADLTRNIRPVTGDTCDKGNLKAVFMIGRNVVYNFLKVKRSISFFWGGGGK